MHSISLHVSKGTSRAAAPGTQVPVSLPGEPPTPSTCPSGFSPCHCAQGLLPGTVPAQGPGASLLRADLLPRSQERAHLLSWLLPPACPEDSLPPEVSALEWPSSVPCTGQPRGGQAWCELPAPPPHALCAKTLRKHGLTRLAEALGSTGPCAAPSGPTWPQPERFPLEKGHLCHPVPGEWQHALDLTPRGTQALPVKLGIWRPLGALTPLVPAFPPPDVRPESTRRPSPGPATSW